MKKIIKKTWRVILLFSILALRMYVTGHGQTITPAGIGNCSYSYKIPLNQVTFEWIIGESFITTLDIGGLKITQGMLQPISQSIGAPLPVTFLQFSASRINAGHVHLGWTTATETNNLGFYIERKTLGQAAYSDLIFVNSTALNGNSSIPLTYLYTDNNNSPDMSFYRLRQTDIDAKISYSPVRAVAGEKEKIELTGWPNPSPGTFYIKINGQETAQARIVDAAGKEIRNFSLKPFIPGAVSGLPAGIYMVQVMINNGEIITKKMVVH